MQGEGCFPNWAAITSASICWSKQVIDSRSYSSSSQGLWIQGTHSPGRIRSKPPRQSLWKTLFQFFILDSTEQLWVFLVDGGSSGTLSLPSKCGISLSGPGDGVGKDGGDYVESVLFQILFGFIWGAGSQFCFGEVMISFYFPAICLVSLPTQLQ